MNQATASQMNRLFYIEPNNYAAEMANKIGNNSACLNTTWNPEDLNISVDLQVVVPNRGDCAKNQFDFPFNLQNQNKGAIGQYVSFLQGSQLKSTDKIGHLTTDYIDASYSEIRNGKISSSESLGITSIDINFDSQFYPVITMNFTDVRAYSLFMPAEENYVENLKTIGYNAGTTDAPGRKYTNLFKALFHFPYPRFLLSIKGFYGNRITFILAANDFKTSFNGNSGNFDVTIKFIGYMYGVYTDIPMSYIMCAPYIKGIDGGTNQYWIDSAFQSYEYKGTNLESIPTFYEFIDRYTTFDSGTTAEEIADSAIGELQKYENELTILQEIKTGFEEFRNSIGNFNGEKKYAHKFPGSVFDVYVVDSNVKPSDIKWNGNLAHDLQCKYDTFWTQYSTDFSSDITTGSMAILNLYGDSSSEEATIENHNHLFNPPHESNEYVRVREILNGDDWDPNVVNGTSKKYLYMGRQVCIGKNTYLDDKPNVSMTAVEGVYKNVQYVKANNITSFFFGGSITDKEELEKQHRKGIKDALKSMGTLDDEQWVFIYPGPRYSALIDEKLQLIQAHITETEGRAEQDAITIYADKLEYSLTLENVFRMIFAHIDTFFNYYINETIYAIKDTNRTFSSVGLQVDETDSYQEGCSQSSFCPPFPAVYQKGSGNGPDSIKLIYPGDKSMAEVEFTNNLINAAKNIGENVNTSLGGDNDNTIANSSDTITPQSVYYALKNLYDKWLCSYGNFDRFKLVSPSAERAARKSRFSPSEGNDIERTDDNIKEINNFIYVDSLYHDIGNEFYCNPEKLYQRCVSILKGEYNPSVYEFMNDIAQDNSLLFKAVPIFSNFYTEEGLQDIFRPHPLYDTNEFEPRGFGSTYIVMYVNEPSKHLDEEASGESSFANDGYDLGDSIGHIVTQDAQLLFANEIDSDKMNIRIPAFGVTFGMQNQQYFKGININMDNPITTDYAILNMLQLSQTRVAGDRNNPVGVGQNIYSIYSNRSYTCTVEMLGCMNIMPMMYFQLNNVPMFKGAYMVMNVSHKITAGNMVTQFTGVRQSKYMYPLVDKNFIVSSLASRITQGDLEKSSHKSNPVNPGNPLKTGNNPYIPTNATEALRKILMDTGHYIHMQSPYEHRTVGNNSRHECTSSVFTWYAKAGYNFSQFWRGMYVGGQVKGWAHIELYGKSEGWKLVAHAAGAKIDEFPKNKLKPGDICVQFPGNSQHVCMWTGGDWRSDFKQIHCWVYPGKIGEGFVIKDDMVDRSQISPEYSAQIWRCSKLWPS